MCIVALISIQNGTDTGQACWICYLQSSVLFTYGYNIVGVCKPLIPEYVHTLPSTFLTSRLILTPSPSWKWYFSFNCSSSFFSIVLVLLSSLHSDLELDFVCGQCTHYENTSHMIHIYYTCTCTYILFNMNMQYY